VSESLAPDRLALLLGLSFFFGLAYEEFYGRAAALSRPGGIRTFPLLAIAGAGLYLIEPAHAGAFAAGLVVLGAWLYAYYQRQIRDTPPDGMPAAELMIPACNLLAYLLGPIVLLQPVKAAYCVVFAGWRVSYAPALALVALSVSRRCSCDNGWKSRAQR
jgi:hypothetical protein